MQYSFSTCSDEIIPSVHKCSSPS